MTVGRGSNSRGLSGARWLIAASTSHPVAVVVIAAALMLFSIGGLARLEVETATESVLDRSRDSWAEYQRFVLDFGPDEHITFLVRSSPGASGATALSAVDALTNKLLSLRSIQRVDSLASVPALVGVGTAEFASESLLPTYSHLPASQFQELLEKVRFGRNWLFSTNGETYGVHATVREPVETHSPSALDAVRRIRLESDAPVSGVPLFREAADKAMRRDVALYVPLTLLVLAVIGFVVLRSWKGVVAGFIAPIVSAALGVALMGWLGTPLSIATVVIPPLVLALGFSYGMHVLCASSRCTDDDYSALGDVAGPIALSGITTVIGMLGIAVIRIDAINRLGVFGGFAIGVLTLMTLTVTPALIVLLGFRKGESRIDQFVKVRIRNAWVGAERNSALVLAVWAALFLASAVAIPHLRVSTNVIDWFEERDPLRGEYDEIRAALAGITPMALVVRPQGERRVLADLESVDAIREFARYIRSLEGVGHVLAVTDLMDQIYSEFSDENVNSKINSQEEIDQLLLFLEGSDVASALLTEGGTAVSLRVLLDRNDSNEIRAIADRAEAWWKAHGSAGLKVGATGVMLEFARAQDEIVFGQLRGFSVAFLGIGMVFLVVFRSVGVTALLLVVNAIPLILVFGFLGSLDLPLDAATAVVSCLALGIAVDDSLHIMSGLPRAGPDLIRAGGGGPVAVAVPVVFSSVSLMLGFAVLGLSGFLPVANLGAVTVGVVATCILADLSLLPAGLRLVAKKFSKSA